MKGGVVLRRFFKGISVYLLIVILIMLLVRTLGNDVEQVAVIDVTDLVEHLSEDRVESIKIVGRSYRKLRDNTRFTIFYHIKWKILSMIII